MAVAPALVAHTETAAQAFGPAVRLSNVVVTVGWPASRGLGRYARMGDAYEINGMAQVYLSPRLADAVEVLGELTHQLAHVAVGVEHGHRMPWRRLVEELGGVVLGDRHSVRWLRPRRQQFSELARTLGEYPHEAPPARLGVRDRVQTTRHLRVACGRCGYLVYVTRTWLRRGLPTCVCGGKFVRNGGS